MFELAYQGANTKFTSLQRVVFRYTYAENLFILKIIRVENSLQSKNIMHIEVYIIDALIVKNDVLVFAKGISVEQICKRSALYTDSYK